MLSAICFSLDQSKILSSGNGLKPWIVWVKQFPLPIETRMIDCLYGVTCYFHQYCSYIAVVSAPIHAFLEFF